MGIAIKVENLSKAYQLGEIGTGTLSRDLERYWAKLRGKEDPFLKIGETNDRTTKGESDMVWSLKDINFEIEQGDAVGIIGRNGAGKSTLLKILSRVTSPTTGSVKIWGRVASLLEVGTGFHPELTGRENIFLNGAILGMRKAEIKKHFDAIVDFAGVERYIDTPVKRYSSGMYVRLAFAVAAHLESEILVVDEVLAVGDAEFQKKCLGKMNEVSKGEGRTVLFVSHQMGMISQLCNKTILLIEGHISEYGPTTISINKYIDTNNQGTDDYVNKIQKSDIYFTRVFSHRNIDNKKQVEFLFNENVNIAGNISIRNEHKNLKIGITLQTIHGYYISTSIIDLEERLLNRNEISFTVEYPKKIIAPNSYSFRLALFNESTVFEVLENVCRINIIDSGTALSLYEGIDYGSVILNLNWKID